MIIFSLVAMTGLEKMLHNIYISAVAMSLRRGLWTSCFFIKFFYLVFFSGQITIRIEDTLWAQLLLEFSPDHFETMHTCSSWSVHVQVVLGLSSLYFLSTFYAPNFKEVGGAYCFWVVRPSVCPSFRPSICHTF